MKEHLIEYIVLFVGMVVFIIFLTTYRFDKDALLIISGVGSIFYILWGILHHILRKRLTRMIVYEYVLFGILVFLLLFTVLSI
ncbi:MAG: hypothetical protein WAX66_02865 [Patescibacteria group bacterium]